MLFGMAMGQIRVVVDKQEAFLCCMSELLSESMHPQMVLSGGRRHNSTIYI